jgi:hypothetical protein
MTLTRRLPLSSLAGPKHLRQRRGFGQTAIGAGHRYAADSWAATDLPLVWAFGRSLGTDSGLFRVGGCTRKRKITKQDNALKAKHS